MRQDYCLSHIRLGFLSNHTSWTDFRLLKLDSSLLTTLKGFSSNEEETGRFQVQVRLGYTLRRDFKINQKKNKQKIEHSNNRILTPSIALFKT